MHVPTGSKAAYEAADQWKDFTTIVEDLPTNENITTTSHFEVQVQNGQVIISGRTTGETIAIYNIQGTPILNQQATSEIVTVNLPARGVYVVKVGTESVKIIN